MKLKPKKGFTLIELLVVVAIIGVLASIVLSSLNEARAKARDARRLSDIKTIQTALELYFLDNNEYPVSTGGTIPNNSWAHSAYPSWETLETALGTDLPEDPINNDQSWAPSNPVEGLNYTYYSGTAICPNRQGYALVYRFESRDATSDENKGVIRCNGSSFRYGGGSITVGASPRQ